MSRRFGRNQKRAMRAQIRANEKIVECKTQAIKEMRRDLDEANAVIERTAQVLGDHFVTLPVKPVEVRDLLEQFRVPIFQPNRSYAINAAVMRALEVIDIDTYRASLRVDELRGTVHMRYQSISGDVGYGLSEHAWRKLSEAHLVDLVTNEIAPEMAKYLVSERKKAGHTFHYKFL